MKTKFLSLILALTLLCSIMVPSVAFADASKGDEITVAASLVNDPNPDSYNDVATGRLSNKNYDDRTGDFTILQVAKNYSVTGVNGAYPHFAITHGLDIAKAFTFQFDYYATDAILPVFSFGNADVFACNNGTGAAFVTDGSALKPVADLALPASKWHTVIFTYDVNRYSVYVDGSLAGTLDALKADLVDTQMMRIGVYSGSKPTAGNGILAVDEVYAYQSAYVPESSEDPVEPEVPETTTAFSYTFEDGSWATGFYTKEITDSKTGSARNAGYSFDGNMDLVLTSPAQNGETKIGFYDNAVKLFDNDYVTFEVDLFKSNTTTPVQISVQYHPQGMAETVLGTFTLAKFQADGTITSQDRELTSDGNGYNAITPIIGKYEANRWYKVTATYNKADQTMDVYINGKLLNEGAGFTYTPDKIGGKFEVSIAKSSPVVAYEETVWAVDNYGVYLEKYDAASDVVTVSANEDSGFKLLNNTFYAKDMYGKKVSEVLAAISVPNDAKIYSDNTYATVLSKDDVIGYGNVMTAVSDSGEVIEYYTFSQGEAGTITHEIVDGVVTAKVYTTIPNGDGYMFVLAKYKGEELLEINQGEIPFNADATATLNAEDGCTYKVFLWSDRLVPLKTTVEF